MVKNLCWFCMPNGAFGHPELRPGPGAICGDIGLGGEGEGTFIWDTKGCMGAQSVGRGVIISVINLKKKQEKTQFGFPDPSLDAIFQHFSPLSGSYSQGMVY